MCPPRTTSAVVPRLVHGARKRLEIAGVLKLQASSLRMFFVIYHTVACSDPPVRTLKIFCGSGPGPIAYSSELLQQVHAEHIRSVQRLFADVLLQRAI